MKILTVSCLYLPTEPNGGASIYAHLLTKEYKNKGNTVAVFTGGINSQKKLYEINKENYEGIDISRINLDYESFDQPIRRILGSEKILKEYKKILKEFKPDIVHFHSIQGLGINIIIETKKLGIKTAITIHDSWWLCPRQFFLKNDKTTFCQQKKISDCSLCYGFLEEKNKIFKNFKKEYEILLRDRSLISVFNSIDIKIFPSKFIHNIYSKYIKNQKNWFISQNGIETPIKKIKKTYQNYINFIFVGGDSKEKGSELLVNTWQKYLLNNTNIKLNIYGSDIENTIDKNTTNNIQYYGKYKNSDISKIMSTNDILIFPSIIPENSPITIKEALSYSLPVIGSNIGGIPELIKENINGLIFENNSEKDLSEKIIKLSNKITIKLFSKNTTNNVQYLENQCDNLLKIFKKSKQTEINIKKIIILNFLNKLFYFNKDKDRIITINFWQKEKIKKITQKSILFNLDKKRVFFFKENKKIIKDNFTNIFQIYRSNSKLDFIISKNYLIEKPGLYTWLKIKKITKSEKIKGIILPFEDLKPLKMVNKILFLIIGINNFITFKEKEIIKYQLKINFDIKNRNIINNLIFITIKFIKIFVCTIVIPIYVPIVLFSLLFSHYGHSRFYKIYQKTLIKFNKLFFKIIFLPLLLIKQFLLLIIKIGIHK